jgi:ATP-dependent Clp protease ATP-binding subunit ClpB
LRIDANAREALAVDGYDPIYGARPLQRLIQKKILNPLAKLVIEGSIKPNQTVNITTEDSTFKIEPIVE